MKSKLVYFSVLMVFVLNLSVPFTYGEGNTEKWVNGLGFYNNQTKEAALKYLLSIKGRLSEAIGEVPRVAEERTQAYLASLGKIAKEYYNSAKDKLTKMFSADTQAATQQAAQENKLVLKLEEAITLAEKTAGGKDVQSRIDAVFNSIADLEKANEANLQANIAREKKSALDSELSKHQGDIAVFAPLVSGTGIISEEQYNKAGPAGQAQIRSMQALYTAAREGAATVASQQEEVSAAIAANEKEAKESRDNWNRVNLREGALQDKIAVRTADSILKDTATSGKLDEKTASYLRDTDLSKKKEGVGMALKQLKGWELPKDVVQMMQVEESLDEIADQMADRQKDMFANRARLLDRWDDLVKDAVRVEDRFGDAKDKLAEMVRERLKDKALANFEGTPVEEAIHRAVVNGICHPDQIAKACEIENSGKAAHLLQEVLRGKPSDKYKEAITDGKSRFVKEGSAKKATGQQAPEVVTSSKGD